MEGYVSTPIAIDGSGNARVLIEEPTDEHHLRYRLRTRGWPVHGDPGPLTTLSERHAGPEKVVMNAEGDAVLAYERPDAGEWRVHALALAPSGTVVGRGWVEPRGSWTYLTGLGIDRDGRALVTFQEMDQGSVSFSRSFGRRGHTGSVERIGPWNDLPPLVVGPRGHAIAMTAGGRRDAFYLRQARLR